jgi:hypothetical protein
MGHTGLDTRVQESELGAVRQRCFDQIAIAPLNDPLVIIANELMKESEALFQGFTPWERKALIPSNFIQGQTRNVRAANEPTSHCALTSARVAKKDQSHLFEANEKEISHGRVSWQTH